MHALRASTSIWQSQSEPDHDLEAMERDNDRNISDIGERVSMLKNITKGIHDEVQAQHGILDGMVRACSSLPMQPQDNGAFSCEWGS